MVAILILALAVVVGFGAYNHHVEQKEAVMAEAEALIQEYDINLDGVLSDDEQRSLIEGLYVEYDGDEATRQELEDAVKKATSMLSSFDADGDGDLSYDEQLSIVQAVYKAYDNGEINNEMLKQILDGYERKVNELNYYHELLNECGVPGGDWHIELRPDKED
jgi:Ca2+-binding EF-hand superfamily protein